MGRNGITVLIENLADDDAMVRENAAYLLGEAAAEARTISENTLKDAGQIEQQCEVLKRTMWDAAMGGLIACLGDEEPWVRGNAADALGKFGEPAVVSNLALALNDSDRVVRLAAADALGQIADPTAIPSLSLATQDSEWSVRLSAIRALARFKDDHLTSVFETAKKDPNSDVRLAGVMALSTQRLNDAEDHSSAAR